MMARQEEAERQRKAAEEAAAKIERDRALSAIPTPAIDAAIGVIFHGTNTAPTPEPAARTAPNVSSARLEETSVAAAHTGVTGTAKLRDEIDDLLIDFDAVELIAAIQSLRSIKARRETRAAA